MTKGAEEDQSQFFDALKAVGGATALATAIFGIFGFLAVRAAINGLGLPDHIEVSVNTYTHYGGRFFFTTVIHLVIVTPALYAAYLLITVPARRFSSIHRVITGRFALSFLVIVMSLAAVAVDLHILSEQQQFQTRLAAQGAQNGREVWLLLLEAAALISVLALAPLWRSEWPDWRKHRSTMPIMPLLTVLVAAQLLLLPLCFGEIAVAPRNFSSVRMTMAQSDGELSGRMIYADGNNYYVWQEDEQALLQIPKSVVRTIRYDVSK